MRRRTAKKNIILPDPKFKEVEVTKFVNNLMIDGKKNICTKGSTFLIPSNVPHSGRALSQCIIMDVFCPKREDLG